MRTGASKLLTITTLALMITMPSTSSARNSLDARIEKLERLVQGQLNVNVLSEVESLSREIRDLRGLLEEQEHSLKLLNKRQEQLYTDLDTRIAQLSNTNTLDITKAPLTSKNSLNSPAKTKAVEKSSYEKAYQLMDNKKFSDAVVAFQDFLWEYPEGEYAPNAFYWLGELYLKQWEDNKSANDLREKAVSSFHTIVDKYQSHHKAVDALLKLGLIEIDNENFQEAKSLLTRVSKDYPGSSRARIAEAKLQRLEQEGRLL